VLGARKVEKASVMKQIRISPAARRDLDEIWFYIAQDNIEAADKLVRAVVSRFSKLAVTPDLGRRREELSIRLHSFPVGRYVILYRPMKGGVEVVRVLDGARDVPPLFG
jgi:toxin ParE1/3/4